MDELGSGFVVRMQEKLVFEELENLPVAPDEKARGITHHVRVSLGERTRIDLGWRVIQLVPPGRGGTHPTAYQSEGLRSGSLGHR